VLGTAVLETTAAALACAGGRRALARDRDLGRLAAAAAREAITITATALRSENPDTPRPVGVSPSTINHLGNHLGPNNQVVNARGPDPLLARVFGSRVGPHAIDALLAVLDAIAPVTPARFFALHYSKLAVQSRETLAAWSARAAHLGLASVALDDLRARLDDVRAVVGGRASAEVRDVA
jgi:hypothetical protein